MPENPEVRFQLFVIEVFVVFVFIAWGTSKRPALGLSICIALLPLFSLTRNLFAYSSFMLFPTLEDLAILFLLFCIFLYSLKHPEESSHKTHLGVDTFAIIVFLGFGLLSSFASIDFEFSLKFLFVGGVIPVLVYGMAKRWVQNDEDIKVFVLAVLAIAVQTILYTVYELRTYPLFFSMKPDVYDVVYKSPITGLFYVPFVTASVLLGVIPLGAWYRRSGFFLSNVVWIVLTMGAVFVAIITFSRGVWLAYIGVLVGIIPLLFSKIRIRDMGYLLISILLLYSIATSEWAQSIFDFRINNIGSEASSNIRSINYALVLRAIPNYFFVGLGLGQYPQIYSDFPFDPASNYRHLWFAHSLILTLLPEIGFVGTLGFVLIFFSGIRKGILVIWGKWEEPRKKLIYALIASIFFSLLIDNISGNHLVAYLNFSNLDRTYFMAPEMILVFAQLGVIMALANGNTSAKSQSTTLTYR